MYFLVEHVPGQLCGKYYALDINSYAQIVWVKRKPYHGVFADVEKVAELMLKGVEIIIDESEIITSQSTPT